LKRSSASLWLGVFLLAISAYPLFLMAREIWTNSAVNKRYRFHGVYESQSATIGNHRISLSDTTPETSDQSAREHGDVQIDIDGKNYATAHNVEIRPAFHDRNRYWGFLALVKVEDNKKGGNFLALAQKLGVDSKVSRLPRSGYDFDYLRFRIISIDQQGMIHDEIFFRKDRSTPVLRARIANYVSPSPMGYYSDIMCGWPSLLFPVIFPWLSGLVGALCIAFALSRWLWSAICRKAAL